jgi:hypothetical protein
MIATSLLALLVGVSGYYRYITRAIMAADTIVLQQAVRNFLAQLPPGERIETLALATTLLTQLDSNTVIEDAREIIRREATSLGVEWWDEK